ncbi:MAG TPA: PEP-CTERM sorting domain-containing protein [Caulobacteraceae bacterium]|jgi:hypothetical protein
MERNYRLASVLGGLAGIAAVIFLATLAFAGPHLGEFLGGESYFQSHHASRPPANDDQLGDPHGRGGCVGPCEAAPVHAPDDSSAGLLPVFDDPGQGLPVNFSFGGDDGHKLFNDGDAPFFGSDPMGGGLADRGSGLPPFFTGVGGVPTGFLGKPPPSSGGTTPPGGGTTPPGGGTTPPGGGTLPPPGGGGSPPTVPEPTAWALFLIGVGAVGAALRTTRPPR